MKSFSVFDFRLLAIFLFTCYLILGTFGCVDTPVEPIADNPIDANSPETGGDPYNLQVEIADGGVRLTWQAVNVNDLVGYNIYRKDNNSAFSRLQQVSSSALTYTDLTIQNGLRYEYYVVVRSTSAEGEASNIAKVAINADPAIYIQGEAVSHTPTRNVTLTMIAFGAQQIILSNESDFAGAEWETFSATKSWQLLTGTGTKIVYMRIVFLDGDTSAVVSDSIEPQALTPLISINRDSTYINHRDVTLSLPVTGALQMKPSNTLDSAGFDWQDYTNQIAWSLPTGDGWKHVYCWFRNDFFTSGMVSDSIGLDTRVAISSFSWISTGGDTLVPDDRVTFTLRTSDDTFGSESGGTANVTVEGWDGIDLVDQADGSYTGSFTITDDTPKVSDARVVVSFADRAGNEVSEESNQRLTHLIPPGMERIFPFGDSGESIVMCWIPSGEFMMGRQDGEQDSDSDESPRHRVTFSEGFWMGKYEVTQVQWEAVMGDNPSYYDGVNRPVERVSWTDIQGFESSLGNAFRLPSESEWEYACRAGTATRFYWGDDGGYDDIDRYAVYLSNDPGGTANVGTKLPNAWGLYDMSGNVWEWCEDWYHSDYTGAPSDGSAWLSPTGSFRVSRGGGWFLNARYCRSANRIYNGPSGRFNLLGFRLVRSL